MVDGWTVEESDITTVYYLDRIPVAIAYYSWAAAAYNLQGNFKTEQYMKSQEFVTLLNQFVSSYESEDETITLRTWKYNEGDYPTFN